MQARQYTVYTISQLLTDNEAHSYYYYYNYYYYSNMETLLSLFVCTQSR